MTELQQLRRMAIYLAERSDDPRYCNPMWVPTVDCLLHQTDECDKQIRESDARIFKSRKDITWEVLSNVAAQNKEHTPCYNCKELIGTPWLKWRQGCQPLEWTQAYKYLRSFNKQHPAKFKLSTHGNETLTVTQMKKILRDLEKTEGFKPKVILLDYADLLAPCPDIHRLDFRQQQNKIWQRLRNMSQEFECLLVTVTQIKAGGYNKKLLSIDDFSEDKRKFAHVTAMYGLNQTPDEKRIGIMRINELVVREADFDSHHPVTVLQRLQMGRPVLGSYR
jgi:hypothetical protein